MEKAAHLYYKDRYIRLRYLRTITSHFTNQTATAILKKHRQTLKDYGNINMEEKECRKGSKYVLKPKKCEKRKKPDTDTLPPPPPQKKQRRKTRVKNDWNNNNNDNNNNEQFIDELKGYVCSL